MSIHPITTIFLVSNFLTKGVKIKWPQLHNSTYTHSHSDCDNGWHWWRYIPISNTPKTYQVPLSIALLYSGDDTLIKFARIIIKTILIYVLIENQTYAGRWERRATCNRARTNGHTWKKMWMCPMKNTGKFFASAITASTFLLV